MANDRKSGRETIGRSRGGLTTKIHLAADLRCRPVARLTSPGQHGDSPRFIPLTDRWPAGTVVTGLALLSAVLLIMTLTGETRPGALLTLIAWGGVGFGLGPALQNHAVRAAPHIPQIASSLAISAFNLGIAAGALAGGRVVASAGIHAVTWIGGLVTSAAVLLALYSTLTSRHAPGAPAGPSDQQADTIGSVSPSA